MNSKENHSKYDVIFVGGGLTNGLLAWQLKRTRPWLSVLVLEKNSRLGGEHTWSFHQQDITPSAFNWIKPLISAHWSYYDVKFPKVQRRIISPYFSIQSQKFHEVISKDLENSLLLNTEVTKIETNSIVLQSGQRLKASVVVDGRGLSLDDVKQNTCGYQKFVGMTVELEGPHGLNGPILMDACVPQEDGFRFVYCLPWSEKTVLIEDTRYSSNPALKMEDLKKQVTEYCSMSGWRIQQIKSTESGCLPLPLQLAFFKGNLKPIVRFESPLTVGTKAGLFHPTTGYSFPLAVQTTEYLLSIHDLTQWLKRHQMFCEAQYRKQRLYFWLNRVMFGAVGPEDRYQFLQHFYELPEKLIHSFYANQFRATEVFEFFMRKPPVKISSAFRAWRRKEIYGI